MVVLVFYGQDPVFRLGRVPVDMPGVVREEQVLAVGGYGVSVRV